MTSWNKRRHSHRHGTEVHAHVGGYQPHDHTPTPDPEDLKALDDSMRRAADIWWAARQAEMRRKQEGN